MNSLSNKVTITLTKGRTVKSGSAWQYEYFHKDHLGNSRVVYGYQKQVDEYKATMESPTSVATKEQAQFYNIITTRATALNRTPASIDVVAPDKSAETNGNLAGKAIGPAKMLQVTAGDRVQLEVFARYSTGTGTNNTLITNLASAVTTTFQTVSGEAAFTALTNNVPVQAATITKASTVPKAYLFYILFNSSYVYQQFGYVQVSSAALAAHQQLYLDITIPTGGYLYTYVANESNVSASTSVYFDDFSIVHTRTTQTLQAVQSNDFYPFGATFNSYSKLSSLENRYLYNQGAGEKKFNTERVLDFSLNVDQSKYRTYDYLTGRWWQVDPKAEKEGQEIWTLYNYSFNNPIRYNDPDGDCVPCTLGLLDAYTGIKAKFSQYSEIMKPGQQAGTRLFSNKSGSTPSDIGISKTEGQILKATGVAQDGIQVAKSIKNVTKEVAKDGAKASQEVGDNMQKA